MWDAGRARVHTSWRSAWDNVRGLERPGVAPSARQRRRGDTVLISLVSQDQPNAMTPAEVSEQLGLDTLKNRQWSIHKSCAIKGDGLEEGLDW